MQRLRHGIDFLSRAADRAFGWIIGLLTAAYVLIILVEVFSRYVLSHSRSWSFELATYLFIVTVFLGTAIGVRERSHLTASLVSGDGLFSRIYRFVIDLICLIIIIDLIYMGYVYAGFGSGRFSPSMGFQMYYLYISIPIAFVFSVLFMLDNWLKGK
jgi:TRAP-type C4-dicarboxylate transport system permease small subunit